MPGRAQDLLVGLLNDVLQPSSPIVSVTLLNPDLIKDGISDRGMVLDLHARLADGRLIDVEMQMRREEMVKRAVYSVSRLYRSQLEAGDEYKKLKPCIGIIAEARGKAEGKAEGRAEGKAEALIEILEARGLAISGAQRTAIAGCQDREILRRWIVRAANVVSVEELLAT